LLLFEREDDTRPMRVLRLDPVANRSYHYWHVFVPDSLPGQLYAYRVDGLFEPQSGLWLDSLKVLLDPHGRGVTVPENYSRDSARSRGDNVATAMKSVVIDPYAYDWEGDQPLSDRPRERLCTKCMCAASLDIPVRGAGGEEGHLFRA
jgi:isoamylase